MQSCRELRELIQNTGKKTQILMSSGPVDVENGSLWDYFLFIVFQRWFVHLSGVFPSLSKVEAARHLKFQGRLCCLLYPFRYVNCWLMVSMFKVQRIQHFLHSWAISL